MMFLCYVLCMVLYLQASTALMMFCDMPCVWFCAYRLSEPWWCFVICLVHGIILTEYHSFDDALWHVLCMVLFLQASTTLMMFYDMFCAWFYTCRQPQPWCCFVICLLHVSRLARYQSMMMFCDMFVHGFMLAGYHSLDDVLWYVFCMVLRWQATTAW